MNLPSNGHHPVEKGRPCQERPDIVCRRLLTVLDRVFGLNAPWKWNPTKLAIHEIALI
jgi:hypothetical protein